MDMIDLMPPGLYEAVITGVDPTVENPQLVQGGYLFTLETRKLDDIRALGGNSAEDDLAFATAARVSEVTQGVYSTLTRPAVRAMVTETGAELMRRVHPNRLGFEIFADENPLMRPVASLAETVRENRRPARQDNPFLAFERIMAEMIGGGLKLWGEARDAATEVFFFNTYGSPLLQAMTGLRADATSVRRRIARDGARETAAAQAAAHLEEAIDQGGLRDAVVRALIYIRLPEGKVDERGFAAIKQIGAELPPAERIGLARFKEIVKEQYLIVLQDAERAIAALPTLLPDDRQREEALVLLHRLLDARGALSEEGRHRLERVEALLALSPRKVGREKAA
jgi:hypothetical protein